MTGTELEITGWTAEQFERIVLDCGPRVAVFDCDGTLWGGDAGYGFMAWSLEQGLVSRSTSDWIDTRHRAYRAGQVSEKEICGEMVQIYSGLRDQELRRAAAQYFSGYIEEHIFPEMTALVAALRKQGAELWAVSSSNRWIIEEGVRRFEIAAERVLAAEVRVANGIITSELVDVPTGAGKAAALRRVGLTHPDAVFGNSIHDLDMLDMARCAFPVNPSPLLLDTAGKRGWGYFRPASVEGRDATVAGE